MRRAVVEVSRRLPCAKALELTMMNSTGKRPWRVCDCGATSFAKSTRGRTAIADASDIDALARFNWSSTRLGHIIRRHRVFGREVTIFIHQQILSRRDGMEIDHINGDPTDNRRANLRHATKAQNQMNRSAVVSGSGFKGVTRNHDNWTATISRREGGRRIRKYLGTFNSKEDAARAYDAAASILFGEFARTNAQRLEM